MCKYLEGGTELALYDRKRKWRPAEISPEAVAWVISLACQRPADLGYSQQLWTLAKLHKHIQDCAAQVVFLRLTAISKTRVQQILKKQEIKPFKVKYYCEKREPDFETKMHELLTVYKQVEMQLDENGDIIVPDDYSLTITVSYDEKPGIQAIATTLDDLRPTERNGEVLRDYEYKRLGTVSLLAGIDLLTGETIPRICQRKRKHF